MRGTAEIVTLRSLLLVRAYIQALTSGLFSSQNYNNYYSYSILRQLISYTFYTLQSADPPYMRGRIKGPPVISRDESPEALVRCGLTLEDLLVRGKR